MKDHAELIERCRAVAADMPILLTKPPMKHVAAATLEDAAAALQQMAERVRELEGVYTAARHYYAGWMQDEASEDYKEWVGCSDKQHQAAAALRDALKRARQARKDRPDE